MPKATMSEVRASLIRAGQIAPVVKQPTIRGAHRVSTTVSKLNAILARRKECAHA